MKSLSTAANLLLASVLGLGLGCDGGSDPRGAGADAGPSCGCSIAYNGVTHELSCGQTACVHGLRYECSASLGIVDMGSCTGDAFAGGTREDARSQPSADVQRIDAKKISECSDRLAPKCQTCIRDVTKHSCSTTAAEGDEAKCVAWWANNARLCTI